MLLLHVLLREAHPPGAPIRLATLLFSASHVALASPS